MLSTLQICALNNEIKQKQIRHSPSELSLILISLLLWIIIRSTAFSMKSFPQSINSLSRLMSDGISSPYQNICWSLLLLPMDLNYRVIKSIIPIILTSHILKIGITPTEGFLMVSATGLVGLDLWNDTFPAYWKSLQICSCQKIYFIRKSVIIWISTQENLLFRGYMQYWHKVGALFQYHMHSESK